MKTIEDARLLAKTMVAIGTLAGRQTIAVLTDMNEPLGNMVGNILEVKEAIACLKGHGEKRLMEVSKILAAYMLIAGKKADSVEDAMKMVECVIESGEALAKMKEFVVAQGGDGAYIEDESLFEEAKYTESITGNDLLAINEALQNDDGAYLVECDNQEIGMTSLVLGGGRQTKESVIDLTVGIILEKHLGDYVAKDDVVGVLYGNDLNKIQEAKRRFINAYTLSADNSFQNKVVYEIITQNDL